MCSVRPGHRSKDLPGLTCTDSVIFQKNIPKISHHRSLSPKYKEPWSFHVVVLQRTTKKCTKIQNARAQPLLCSYVWCRSRHRRRGGLLKLPIVRWETGHAFYVIGLRNIRIHPSTRYRIRCGFIFSTLAPSKRYRIRCGYFFFSTLESGFIFFRTRCRIRRIRVDGSRIRKEKVADSKLSGYVWTEPKSLIRALFIRKSLSSYF